MVRRTPSPPARRLRKLRTVSALLLVVVVGAVVVIGRQDTFDLEGLVRPDTSAQAGADLTESAPAEPLPLQAPTEERADQEPAAAAAPDPGAPAPEASAPEVPAPVEPVAAEDGGAAETFPGQSANTLTATVGEATVVDGVSITVSPLQAFATASGPLLCALVTVVNTGVGRPFLSPVTFTLQNPQGIKVSATLTRRVDSTPLPTSDLEPGATAEGEVCFNTPATAGQHVILYEPFSAAEHRGAWVQTV